MGAAQAFYETGEICEVALADAGFEAIRVDVAEGGGDGWLGFTIERNRGRAVRA
jgi:hypothetical protein